MTKRKDDSRLKIARLWLIKAGLVALLLAGCQKGAPGPVAIEPEDMCSFCKMAISEKRYAAEFIDNEGQAFKFDDIACMARFTREMRGQGRITARFVMDFEAKTWLKAEDGYYVQAKEIKTPMSGGIVAFNDESAAEETARQYGGKVLRIDDVFFGELAD